MREDLCELEDAFVQALDKGTYWRAFECALEYARIAKTQHLMNELMVRTRQTFPQLQMMYTHHLQQQYQGGYIRT